MEIQYNVVPNALRPGQYYPRPAPAKTLNLEQVVSRAISKTNIPTATIAMVVRIITDAIAEGLLLGHRVSIDGLADFSIRLSQTMSSPEDRFDFRRGGQLLVSARVKPQLVKRIRVEASLKKTLAVVKVPILAEFKDLMTGTAESYTPDSMGIIFGRKLKIGDTSDPLQGVFFVADPDGTEQKAAIIETNEPSRLTFVMPDRLTGNQRLQVRTRYTSHGQLRTGELDNILTRA